MVTFTLTTPATVGSLGAPVTLRSLQITGINSSLTPPLAPVGTGILELTLTDPTSGWQETISYRDASVPALWALLQSPAANTKLEDIVGMALFSKLIADGKLPAGSLSTS